MKYQSSNTKIIYNIQFDTGIKKLYQCPECSQYRKKSKSKVLEYYPDTKRAYCFHCNTTFFEYKPYEQKQYTCPEWKNITKLTEKAVKWFEGRMIKQSTLNKMKIYSDVEYMPQFQKKVDVICFPYFMDDKLINIKYRGPQKSFKLNSGSELIFWNIDSLKDSDDCIICEGELDMLSYIEIGCKAVLSVPNGSNKNLEYLNNYIELFKPLKKIYISVDNDTNGLELRDELIRRLGIERCYLVNLKDCKDANEYFLKYSGNELFDAFVAAKQIPIEGITKAENIYNDLVELYENGITEGQRIDNYEIDQYCTWEIGKLAIVTGEPNSGKSEFIDFIVCKLNLLYGWKVAYFTPENYPLKYHYSKIYEKLIGKKFKKTDQSVEFDMAFEYINDNYFYILNENDLTPKTIIDNAKYLVVKEGIKILVIDPYNKLDHQYDKNMTETQYISKFLDNVINFARFYNVLVFLVAHPTKLQPGQNPNLYSISGSANFYNKTDYGFSFIRLRNEENILTNESQVHWQKFRFRHLGKHGISNLVYNYNNGRFEKQKTAVDYWDNENWLVKNMEINDNELQISDEKVPF